MGSINDQKDEEVIREGPVISQPNGLTPKMKRLVLKNDCLILYGFKSGKVRRLWVLQDVLSVKRHTNNISCFTILCNERKKNNKVKEKRYSFEVKTEKICVKWIECIQKAKNNARAERIRAATRGRALTSPDGESPIAVRRATGMSSAKDF